MPHIRWQRTVVRDGWHNMGTDLCFWRRWRAPAGGAHVPFLKRKRRPLDDPGADPQVELLAVEHQAASGRLLLGREGRRAPDQLRLPELEHGEPYPSRRGRRRGSDRSGIRSTHGDAQALQLDQRNGFRLSPGWRALVRVADEPRTGRLDLLLVQATLSSVGLGGPEDQDPLSNDLRVSGSAVRGRQEKHRHAMEDSADTGGQHGDVRAGEGEGRAVFRHSQARATRPVRA